MTSSKTTSSENNKATEIRFVLQNNLRIDHYSALGFFRCELALPNPCASSMMRQIQAYFEKKGFLCNGKHLDWSSKAIQKVETKQNNNDHDYKYEPDAVRYHKKATGVLLTHLDAHRDFIESQLALFEEQIISSFCMVLSDCRTMESAKRLFADKGLSTQVSRVSNRMLFVSRSSPPSLRSCCNVS